ncbi:MAG: hypothetical protein U5L03_16650 [Burkholderiaceae bacterium]|nr:hypothetical protein [Burkholderiaceae bacterium]
MDLGLVAQSVSRIGAAADARAASDRVNVNVRLLLPLLQSTTAGLSTELSRDLRAALAGRDAVRLVLPLAASPGAVPARLEVGTRQFALPVGLRDALLATLGSAGREAASSAAPAAMPPTPAAATAADSARAWAVAAQTTAAAAVVVSGTGLSRLVHRTRDDRPAPTVQFNQPLLEPVGQVRAVQAAAERLRHNVERSGLFFEAHVAQWAQGARDTAEMRAEALRLLPAAAESAAQRVAAQVAVLQDAVLSLLGPVWPGQSAALVVEREAPAGAEATGEPVFSARLALALPALGAVQIHLRLAGHAVTAAVSAPRTEPFAAGLADLAAQLRAHGLEPVGLHADVTADVVAAAGDSPASAADAAAERH